MLHIAQATIEPPRALPHLFPRLVTAYSSLHFLALFALLTWRCLRSDTADAHEKED